jgi:RNA polymerase II subunit A C-terminal domain phosphatase SSU72
MKLLKFWHYITRESRTNVLTSFFSVRHLDLPRKYLYCAIPMSTKRVALVCASNQNRSMEAHALLLKKGWTNVASFGTNTHVKLPGPAQDKPIIFEFSTPYQQMYDILKQQDEELYTSKGILNMLQRNSKIKERPQRFQDEKMPFDIIITFEERVFDIVVEDLNGRDSITGEVVHVININVKDNHEEATLGAIEVLNLLTLVLLTKKKQILRVQVRNGVLALTRYWKIFM